MFGKSHLTWRTEREERIVAPACLRPGHTYAYGVASARDQNDGGPPV